MAGSFSSTGGDTTVTFAYTTNTTKMLNIITAAAHCLWNMGYGDHTYPNTFAGLNNQQKVDIVDAFIKWRIKEFAKQQTINDASAVAAADAEANLSL